MNLMNTPSVTEQTEPQMAIRSSDGLADSDVYVDFKGWRFRAPFRCLCCGSMVSLRQFCFGRCCAPCDVGKCRHRRAPGCYSGPRELINANDPYFIAEDRWLNPIEGLASHSDDSKFDKREEMLQRVLSPND